MRNAFLLCGCVVSFSLLSMGCSDDVTLGTEGVDTSARGSENFRSAETAPTDPTNPVAPVEGTEPTPGVPPVDAPAPADPPSVTPADTGACPDFASFAPMPECCGGAGSCLPMDELPPGLQSQVSTCDDGGACVPKGVIESIEGEGGFWPVACASIGGAAGACLSTCIPKVGEFAAFLPQDICAAGERCAPCIDPLTGEDSGACGDGLDCFAELPPTSEPSVSASSGTGACPDFGAFAPMPQCCGGAGSCMPMDEIPAGLQSQVSTCDDGGACVPNGVIESIESEGGFWPVACASIGGAAGACLSTCIPKVGEFAAFLPQDICAAGELCAPCIDPLTGEDSGACGDGLDCFAEVPPEPEPASEPAPVEPPAEPLSCENLPTEPVVDPTTFTPCGTAAHCVPAALVGAEDQENLSTCAGGFCVPDVMIASGGYFVPAMCTSVGGAEGRCLNTVLPAVADLADTLPVATCEPFERCSPCCDPMTGLSTDVCDQGCDEGPEAVCDGVPLFPSCCDGAGHCIDPGLVPDDMESNLAKCDGDGDGLLCVPDVMQDPDYAGSSCIGNSLLLGQYGGVCLPKCLKIFLKISFDKSPCPDDYMCVPCQDPLLGSSTGAPGCAP